MRRPLSLFLPLALIAFLLGLGRGHIVTDLEARVVLTAQTMSTAGWPWNATPVPVELRVSASPTSKPTAKTATKPTTRRMAAPRSATAPTTSPTATPVNPWLVPIYRDAIRLQKPPLPYWCTAVLFKLLGETEFAARLTPAFLGALATLLIYRLGHRLAGPRIASLAAGVWLSTYFIRDEYRKAMADPYLAFFTLAALTALVELAHLTRRVTTSSPARLTSAIPLTIAAFYLSLALGCLSKGPVLFLHLAIAITAHAIATRRITLLTHLRRHWPLHLAGLAAFLAITLPWPLYILANLPNALDLWRFESVGEFTDNSRNARPLLFYLLYLPFFPLPWLLPAVAPLLFRRRRAVAIPDSAPTGATPPPSDILSPPGPCLTAPSTASPTPRTSLALPAPRRQRQAALFALLWIAFSVAIFSAVHMKKIAYLLPLAPAFTLLAALGLAAALRLARAHIALPRLGLLAGAHSIVSISFAVVLSIMIARGPFVSSQWPLIPLSLLLGALPLVIRRPEALAAWLRLQLFAFAALLTLFLAYPAADRDNRRAAVALTPHLPDQTFTE